MSEDRESDQIVQRRANFEALSQLGVDAYPHAFERSHTVRELVRAYGERTSE
jgi:lysyl-tRNA synthetase class II